MYRHSFRNDERHAHITPEKMVRNNLAFSVYKLIEEVQTDITYIDSITTPLIIEDEWKMHTAQLLLRVCPEAITRPVARRIGREVLLRLDVSVEPPMLTIELGDFTS